MKRIVTVATGILASLALAVPANAQTISITDPKGDANWFENDPAAIPFSYGPADITKATVGTVFKKVGRRNVAVAVKATMTLAEKPAAEGSFWWIAEGYVAQQTTSLTGATVACSSERFRFNLIRHWDGSTRSFFQSCDPDGTLGPKSSVVSVPAKISGTTITWTVPLSKVKAQGIPAGATMKDFEATTWLYHGYGETASAGGFPNIDSALSKLTYNIGK